MQARYYLVHDEHDGRPWPHPAHFGDGDGEGDGGGDREVGDSDSDLCADDDDVDASARARIMSLRIIKNHSSDGVVSPVSTRASQRRTPHGRVQHGLSMQGKTDMAATTEF